MANRSFTQWLWSAQKNPVRLWAYVTFGSTGAPTLSGINSKGIKTIVRNSTGNYTVTFGSTLNVDTYNKLLLVTSKFIKGSGTPAAPSLYVTLENVTAAGQVTLQFTAPTASTATDPASGEVVLLDFDLKTVTAN